MKIWQKWKEIKAIHEDKYPEFKPWFQFLKGMVVGSIIIIPMAVWMLYHILSTHGVFEQMVRYFMQ